MNKNINIPEYEVSEFNKVFKQVVENNFNYVRIKGEISEIKTATKGQIYLTLKDNDSILSAVIWEQKIKFLDIMPELGLEIIATGKITTWSRFKTTYQIDIDKVEIAGEGALLKLIEERKKRLKSKGYFDEEKKKPLPYLPTRIGIITSPTGSVIYDIINRVTDRFPMPLDVWPVAVQGNEAVSSISKAILGFNKMTIDKPDVIIIARGGGSTEDLMAFNDEYLATKVFESKIPIVSAIGHETDNTIIDLVADLRAATPTAAAEKIVPIKYEINDKIKNLNFQLDNKLKFKVNLIKDNYLYLKKLIKAPNFIVSIYNEKISTVSKKINLSIKNNISINNLRLYNIFNLLNSPNNIIKFKSNKINQLIKLMEKNIIEKYNSNNNNLISNLRLLNSNSISSNLKKGYSILTNRNNIVKDKKNLKLNQSLKAKVSNGSIEVIVKKIN